MTRATRCDGIRTADDLMARCWVDEDTGCWHWRGALDANGAPSMWLPALQRIVSLGVVAAVLSTGAGPRPGQVWHCTCETRHCANPAHRKRGSRSSMMFAARLTCNALHRARISATKRAAKRAASHITPEQRAEIAGSADTLRVIAARYGISISQARSLRSTAQAVRGAGVSVFNWRPQ